MQCQKLRTGTKEKGKIERGFPFPGPLNGKSAILLHFQRPWNERYVPYSFEPAAAHSFCYSVRVACVFENGVRVWGGIPVL
jgi:hypothetical protein